MERAGGVFRIGFSLERKVEKGGEQKEQSLSQTLVSLSVAYMINYSSLESTHLLMLLKQEERLG
jgi:hypothetical protein